MIDEYEDDDYIEESLYAKLSQIEKELESPEKTFWERKNLELESSMAINGQLQHQHNIDKADLRGSLSSTYEGGTLTARYINQVTDHLETLRESYNTQTGKTPPLFQIKDMQPIALLGLHICINAVGLYKKAYTMTSYAMKAGEVASELIEQELTDADNLRTGHMIIEATCDATGLFELTLLKSSSRKRKDARKWCITPNTSYIEELQEIIQDSQIHRLSKRPMTCKPKDWDKATGYENSCGGYHTLASNISSNMRGINNTTHNADEAPEFFKALNLIQATEFSINRKMLDIIRQQSEEIGELNLTIPEPFTEPYPLDWDDDKTDEEKEIAKEYFKRKKDTKHKIQRALSKNLVASTAITLATQYAGYTTEEWKKKEIARIRSED